MKSVNTDVAYDYIRKRILSGEFSPGQALLTETLASEIKVSRTPVRDALRKLETDGLVTIRAHLGASVKKMNLKEFREMSDLRLALESHAAGLAAVNRTDADLSAIKFALDAMRFLTEKIVASDNEQPFLGDLVRDDIRFHIAIMVASKNELMQREIMRLHLLHRVVSGLSNVDGGAAPKAESDVRRQAVLAKHEDIYRAIASGDAREAKSEMGYHLQELIDHNLYALARAQAGVLVRDLTAEELLYSGHH
ncbi:MAG: GntR family transcriptional regulator [Verrucomicrobia bacterium]|jgi:DNA-binding GntR family transcriptional regulator|nr:GntR family transcriptional regulator [Verrucomicrobiota bacterium]